MLADIHDDAWRPLIPGWSADILPYYDQLAEQLDASASVVEIGVHSGRSIFRLAEQLLARAKPHVQLFAIDWWTGPNFREQLLHTIVGNRFNGITAEEIDMVKIISAEGVRAARLFDDGSLDVVFIDSDHEYLGMRRHLHAWVPKVKPGGIIAGHDYSTKDWPGVVQAVDEYFGAELVQQPSRSVWEVRC